MSENYYMPNVLIFNCQDSDAGKVKRRRSRWGNDEKEKAFIPGMPTVIPSTLSKTQEKAYLCKFY